MHQKKQKRTGCRRYQLRSMIRNNWDPSMMHQSTLGNGDIPAFVVTQQPLAKISHLFLILLQKSSKVPVVNTWPSGDIRVRFISFVIAECCSPETSIESTDKTRK